MSTLNDTRGKHARTLTGRIGYSLKYLEHVYKELTMPPTEKNEFATGGRLYPCLRLCPMLKLIPFSGVLIRRIFGGF